MTKAEARKIIDGMGLPVPQAKAAHRTVGRATGSEDIAISPTSSGDLLVKRSRPGRIGYQVFEDLIRPDGSKEVVPKAYDDAGNLVHHDPKGGTA
jgi:hypothetical protein